MKGTVESTSIHAAADLIREQKMIPIRITMMTEQKGLAELNSWMGRVSTNDLANFTRQLATMITAGLPLTDALNLLRIQSPPALAKIVTVILADVQSGVSLSSALAKHPQVFSKVYVALVRAGEAAGVMENILNRLADTTEKSREFRSKVGGAMIYPVIILIGMVGVSILMVTVVIPKLTTTFPAASDTIPSASTTDTPALIRSASVLVISVSITCWASAPQTGIL